MEQNVVKTDKCMVVSQLLGDCGLQVYVYDHVPLYPIPLLSSSLFLCLLSHFLLLLFLLLICVSSIPSAIQFSSYPRGRYEILT